MASSFLVGFFCSLVSVSSLILRSVLPVGKSSGVLMDVDSEYSK